MKKKILLAVMIHLLSLTYLFAQDNMVEKKFRFGLKLAPSVLWYKSGSTGLTSDGAKFGFAYGLMADYLLTENYSISSGIEMLMMNAKYTIELPANALIPPINIDYKANYQFVQIPIAIKMRSNEIGAIRYFGRFGFNNAICYKSTANFNTNGNLTKNKDISADTRSFRFALTIGGGAEYSISGSTSIIAGLHFDNSFLNMNKSSSNKIYSRGIVLDLGVIF